MPVSSVFFWLSVAGMPDDIVERHVELLADQVRPAVVDLGLSAGGQKADKHSSARV
jgi:hypothetical protein